jgi:hypothetical protein
MYALQNKASGVYMPKTLNYFYATELVSQAVKFKTRAEAEFILQDLKSRSMGLQYQVVEVD